MRTGNAETLLQPRPIQAAPATRQRKCRSSRQVPSPLGTLQPPKPVQPVFVEESPANRIPAFDVTSPHILQRRQDRSRRRGRAAELSSGDAEIFGWQVLNANSCVSSPRLAVRNSWRRTLLRKAIVWAPTPWRYFLDAGTARYADRVWWVSTMWLRGIRVRPSAHGRTRRDSRRRRKGLKACTTTTDWKLGTKEPGTDMA